MTGRRARPRSTDAHAWANWIRTASPELFGGTHCADPADEYDSPFRRAMRLPAIHVCQLRELARRQVTRED